MSIVTNLILTFSIGEDESSRTEEVNNFSNQGRGFKLVSADFERISSSTPYEVKTWYAGTKFLETPLFIGAYNHLDLSGLVRHLKSVRWEEPENVQLMLKTQDSNKFKIIELL
jgi:hypothetical protein